jgi:hypothetical protein
MVQPELSVLVCGGDLRRMFYQAKGEFTLKKAVSVLAITAALVSLPLPAAGQQRSHLRQYQGVSQGAYYRYQGVSQGAYYRCFQLALARGENTSRGRSSKSRSVHRRLPAWQASILSATRPGAWASGTELENRD